MALQVVRGPYMTMATKHGVTLHWRTDSACNSVVKLGTSAGALINTITNLNVVTDHVITIHTLQPNTLYYYSIGTTSFALLSDSACYFKTLPLADSTYEEPIRFWVLGDMGKQSQQQLNVRNAYLKYVGSKPAQGWILLGDNAYQNGLDIDYQNGFFNYYQQDILKNTVLWPALGNHDYANDYTLRTTHQLPYLNIFSLPANAEAGGIPSGTRRYYSFDYGNVHFVNLDSYGLENVGGVFYGLSDTLFSPQVNWLKADLNANQLPWVIVSFHHPPYCMGTHNSDAEYDLVGIRTQLNPILERYNVDLELNGHCHTYQRSKFIKNHFGMEATFDSLLHVRQAGGGTYDGSPNSCAFTKEPHSALPVDSGGLYLVIGSGGAAPQLPFAQWPHDAMHYSNYADNGSLLLTIEGTRLTGEWISTDTLNVIKDRFTLFKGSGRNRIIQTQFPSSHTLKASWKSPAAYLWSTGDTSREITCMALSDTILTVQDPYSCLTDTFTIHAIPLGMSESVSVKPFSVYPNPTKGELTLHLPELGKYSLNLFSMDGKLIFHQQVEIRAAEYKFNLPISGEYMLECISASGNHYKAKVEKN
jgi:hypothetical protein